MSTPRFAPITASLFARKGDATPSAVIAKPSLLWTREPNAPPPAVPHESHTPPPPPPPAEAERPHRMMIALTTNEFEKLGIAAVKKGVTRHQIIRTALDLHLDRLKREYGGCGCMAMDGGGCGCEVGR